MRRECGRKNTAFVLDAGIVETGSSAGGFGGNCAREDAQESARRSGVADSHSPRPTTSNLVAAFRAISMPASILESASARDMAGPRRKLAVPLPIRRSRMPVSLGPETPASTMHTSMPR